MPLSPGAKLDGYEVLGPIGAGGMGEVYRARDSVLKREVAIKVLPAFYSQDPDRLGRFEQEAQAAAALNHPNILVVYQFGSFQGAPYLVSELLEGSTLRQVLDGGPLPVRKAIDIGVQIAHGLAAAHEKGIVHRDLKPENLFVTKNGRVKILDFGLAKLKQSQPDPDSLAPTQAKGTEAGMVMGTAGYMAPEQVRGTPVDHRADIFAFGAILYEMLAGRRAFQRSTSAETMAAILNDDPPAVSQMMQSTPPGLQRVVHRCLEKSPEQRFQSAADLAFALEALSDSGGSAAIPAQPGKRSRWVWAVAGAGVALAGLGIAWWRIPPAVPVVESSTQLTNDGEPKPYVIVNDISRIYFNEGRSESKKIVQVSISGGLTAPVETRFANPTLTRVAFDGSMLGVMVGYYPSNALWAVPLPAGEPRPVASGKLMSTGTDFFPDGRIVYGKGNDSNGVDFFVADKNGSNPRKLVSVPGHNVWNIEVSSDGQQILFREHRGKTSLLHVMAADGGGLRDILKDDQLQGKCCFRWNSDGRYIVYLSQIGNQYDIWALPTETGLFRRSREPIRLTAGPLSYTAVEVNRQGKQIFAVVSKPRGELIRYDLKSHQFVPFLSGISATEPTFSRDGKWVAYSSYPDHTLWRSRSDGSERMQLTFPPMVPRAPYISPDGTKVAFDGFPGDTEAFLINMDGGQPQAIAKSAALPNVSPDGKLLLFGASTSSDSTKWELRILDFRTEKISAVPSSQQLTSPLWVSQDELVAATEDHKKLLTFDFKTQKWSDLAAGTFISWAVSPDSAYLYVLAGGSELSLQRIRFADHQVETITSLKDVHLVTDRGYTAIDIAPDGSPVFTRDTGYGEIYALNVRWP